MSATADAVIIGGGIVGAACAHALSREGLRATIVEPAIVGGGATAAGMGHIVVMDDSEPQFALTRYSSDLWNDLAPRLPPEVEFERCGTLWIAADDEEFAAALRKREYYQQRGVSAEILDSRALTEAEPNLRAGLAGGLLIPGDSVIYAPYAARWLTRNIDLESAAPVARILSGGVELADGRTLSAGCTICAAGTWSTSLLPELHLRPRKGHLAITERYSGFVRHQLVELGYLKSAHGDAAESVAFNAQPRKTGQVLIGSSRQYGNTDSAVDAPILRRMLARAVDYMPALAGVQVIRTWTGFRAATGDNLPLIGPCPGWDNLFLATGHEGLGITTSLATARIVADLILGRTPAIDAAAYSPSRFARAPTHA
jgi:glycine/D-amino acid oxidase-like deaminating enzyme